MIEPSAGRGAFYKLLPCGSLGIDLEPKCCGVLRADFLTATLFSDLPICAIGNPLFGKKASLAVRFFNRAADQCQVIAFIVPKSFRKASIQRQLNRNFHLVREGEVPEQAFIFEGRPFSVSTVFQIWERRAEVREVKEDATRHPDFKFTTPDLTDFAIQRVGARAGRVHRDFSASPSSHYFILLNAQIRGGLERAMRAIDFSSVVRNVAANPSLSKGELVQLYDEWLADEACGYGE